MITKIRILVDIGYAFDYFSILELKNKKGFLADNVINLVKSDMIDQISEQVFNEIHNSVEYSNLLEANIQTFNAVDRAKTNNITAKEVDDCNTSRYHAKIALLRAFTETDDNSLIEVKV